MADFDFLFSKIWQKYSYFLKKIHVWRKNQNGGRKPRWRQVDYFSNRNSIGMPSSGFVRYIF
jgi:hypothetical protein